MRNICTSITIVSLWISQISANTLSRPGSCIPNEPCVFDCSLDSICEEGNLHCASGESCDVLCANDNACKNANIFGNSASTLTVACSAKTACGDANIDGTGVHSVTVSCAGVDSCKGDTHVICGQSQCSVNCPISTACEQLHIDSSKTSSYHCTGPFCTDIGTVVPFPYIPNPTKFPTTETNAPTNAPTKFPTTETNAPTKFPTETNAPTKFPTETNAPTRFPTETNAPTKFPTETNAPTKFPTRSTLPKHQVVNVGMPQVPGSTLNEIPIPVVFTTTTTTTEAPLHANVYAVNNLPPGVVIPPDSIPPGAEYVVVLPATVNNILTNVDQKDGTQINLGMCEGDCDFDSDCIGDLKCYERDYDNHIVPGCIGRPYKNWDYCTRGERFAVSTTTTTVAPGHGSGLPFVARSNQVDLDDNGLNNIYNNVDNVVVSFSAETVRNIWILIILFLVVNGGVAYFYCFRSRGKVQMIFDEETNSNI